MPTFIKYCNKCERELLFAEEPNEIVICSKCGNVNNYGYDPVELTQVSQRSKIEKLNDIKI